MKKGLPSVRLWTAATSALEGGLPVVAAMNDPTSPRSSPSRATRRVTVWRARLASAWARG